MAGDLIYFNAIISSDSLITADCELIDKNQLIQIAFFFPINKFNNLATYRGSLILPVRKDNIKGVITYRNEVILSGLNIKIIEFEALLDVNASMFFIDITLFDITISAHSSLTSNILSVFITKTSSGGSLVGGFGDVDVVAFLDATISSNSEIAADVVVVSEETTEGGVVVGGIAKFESPVYHFQSDGLPEIVLSGASLLSFYINITSDGGIVIDGQSKSHLGFHLISEGGVVFSGGSDSSSGPLTITKSYEFSWRTNLSTTINYEFAWSTGIQRSYFYRVTGKGKIDTCNPLQVDDCCKKFIINIQARSLDDVCTKLRERVGVWPIEKIQRFSRPAERSVIEEDIANGINYDCNVAEDVDFCNIPVCADFCVEYDLRETWGGYAILEMTEVSSMGVRSLSISRKRNYKTQGGLKIFGQCQSKLIRHLHFNFANKIFSFHGNCKFRSTHHHYQSNGGFTIQGSAGKKRKHWKLQSEKCVELIKSDSTLNIHGWDRLDDNSYFCILDANVSPELVIDNFFDHGKDCIFSGVIIEIDRYANGLIQDAEIVLFNNDVKSRNLAKKYNWPLALPVPVVYGSALENWGLPSFENLKLGIKVRPIVNSPNLKATIREIKVFFAHNRGGLLKMNGTSNYRFSHHYHQSKGRIKLNGQSLFKSIDRPSSKPLVVTTPIKSMSIVPPSPSKGLLIRALSDAPSTTITSINQTIVPEMMPLGTMVSKCNCSGMPLSIPFSNNLSNINKLSQFVQRNGQTIPRFITLQYNKTNESWQSNLRYSGNSATASDSEVWNILFELQCTDLLGGVQIGQGIWRFGMRVTQKNLVTGQDYDSRVLTAFLPDPICSKGREFRVKLTFDTQMKLAMTSPIATIYDVVVYDNIGIFKSSTWLSNPKLIFDISQAGLPSISPRIPLDIT